MHVDIQSKRFVLSNPLIAGYSPIDRKSICRSAANRSAANRTAVLPCCSCTGSRIAIIVTGRADGQPDEFPVQQTTMVQSKARNICVLYHR